MKGNPEIKLWNGFVEDWTDFQLSESELVKESDEFVRWWIEASWKNDNNSDEIPADVQERLDEIIKQNLKKRTWDFPNHYLSDEDMKRWYGKNRKRVVLIDAKRKGVTTFDRLGEISY